MSAFFDPIRLYGTVLRDWVTGREAGCAIVEPLRQRSYMWAIPAAAAALIAQRVAGLHSSLLPSAPDWVKFPLAGLLVGLLAHSLLSRTVFGGWHVHCDECDRCSADGDGRVFPDKRNATHFAISELAWFVAKRGRRRICPDHSEMYPADYPFRPGSRTV